MTVKVEVGAAHDKFWPPRPDRAIGRQMMSEPPSRLLLDGDALVANWRWLARQSGAARCGAAIQADGYGVGAAEVLKRLAAAGCRDFFVATWDEARALGPLPAGASLAVLHGVRAGELAFPRVGLSRTVHNPAAQLARWTAAGGGCRALFDT